MSLMQECMFSGEVADSQEDVILGGYSRNSTLEPIVDVAKWNSMENRTGSYSSVFTWS